MDKSIIGTALHIDFNAIMKEKDNGKENRRLH